MTNLILKVEAFNKQIIELATIGNWESLTDTVKRRHQSIEKFFDLSDTDISEIFLVKLNDCIINTDKQVKAIISREKNQSIQSSLNLKNAHAAIKSYQTASIS